MRTLPVVLLVPLFVALVACSKPDAPTAGTAPVAVSVAPAIPPALPAAVPVPELQQAAQQLELQTQQMLLLQSLQMQQQIMGQQLDMLGRVGMDVSDTLQRHAMVNACNLSGNCEVRLVQEYPVRP